MPSRLRPACLAAILLLPAALVLADSRVAINDSTGQALQRLHGLASHSEELINAAAGVLVFPDVVRMSFGDGGQYGEGSLLVDNKPVAYYSTAADSFGLQAGTRYKAEVILFMTEQALTDFRSQPFWEVGADTPVELVRLAAGGGVDQQTIDGSVLGFVFSDNGLSYTLDLSGSRITRISR